MELQYLMYQPSSLQIERDSTFICMWKLAANSEQQEEHRLYDARHLKSNTRMAENGSYQKAYTMDYKIPSYTC
jgi:hypothetical protein